MILPVLAITFASTVVWAVLSLFTFGLADHISGPVTSAFISLFGIRVALELKGGTRRTDYRALVLQSLMYGMFFGAALWCLGFIVSLSAIAFALWQVGEPFTWSALENAAKDTQVAFALIAVGSKTIAMLFVLTAFYAVMAVPMASAAHSAGLRASGHRFFNGFGRSFVPLFCVFFVSIFLQVYFGILSTVYALLPIVLSVLSILTSQTLPNFDAEIILKGLAASWALLWLNSWLWSISALAFLKSEGTTSPSETTPPQTEAAEDIRALRKSREQSF
ncbi:hypothetical protein [Ruegeria sp.]|uniref:hypothetical protein n=1 Tax=Ruegeria sp. TaxID=1879320 RepID=UPI003B5AB802